MNDEIKEILDELDWYIKQPNNQDINGEYEPPMELSQEEAKDIYDYITNLQQSLKDMTDINLENEKELTNLQQENERLKETNVYCNRTDCIGRIKDSRKYDSVYQEKEDYKSRCEKAIEQAKEKIKRYESYINDLKKGNYPSPTIRQERQELIFRIREQKDLLNILQNGGK